MFGNNGCSESIDATAADSGMAQQLEKVHISTLPPLPSQPQKDYDYAERAMNMTLFDPPRWGWAAVGGVADLLTPHERSRRRSTCAAFRKKSQKMRRNGRIKTKLVYNSMGEEAKLTTPVTTTQQLKQLDPNTPTAITTQLKDPPTYSIEASLHQPDSSIKRQCAVQSNSKSLTILSKSGDLQESQKIITIESKTPAPGRGPTKHNSGDLKGKHEEIMNRDSSIKNQTQKIVQSSSSSASQRKSDLGMQVMSIPTTILGMKIENSIQKIDDDQKDRYVTENSEESPNNRKYSKWSKKDKTPRRSVAPKYDCHVQSLGCSYTNDAAALVDSDTFCGQVDVNRSNKNILDMYAYHFGREGMEARDFKTGELLVTQQVTDTNHDLDAPKSRFTILIEFPLEDDDDNRDNVCKDCDDNGCKISDLNDDNTKTKNEAVNSIIKSPEKAIYRENISWDLLDKNTPTPIIFASSIGREYGLTFGQTMDLASSIDQQIEDHIVASSQFREPITVDGPQNQESESERRYTGPTIQAYRYDQIIVKGQCGTLKLNKDRIATKSRFLASGQNRTSDGVGTGRRRDILESNVTKVNENDISEEMMNEIKKRSRAESTMIVNQNKNGRKPVLQSIENGICHICKKRQPTCFMFACGQSRHLYCQQHMSSRLGITGESGIFAFDYCPICSLTCECARCKRKLNDVGILFKAKSIDQGKEPPGVYFPDILSTCIDNIVPAELNHAIDTITNQKMREEIQSQHEKQQEQDSVQEAEEKSPKLVKQTRTARLAKNVMVPQPPLSNFPSEDCNSNKELEMGVIDAYFTVFSAQGRQKVDDFPDAWLQDDRFVYSGSPLQTKSIGSEEGGNVDYCHICGAVGDLICCDVCSRVFHERCIENYDTAKSSNGQWVCYICNTENIESEDDLMDGKGSLDIINAAFLNLDPSNGRAIIVLEVLSIIHQMLQYLMEYDGFGKVFSKPVNNSEYPEYKAVIKRPMDLGTIFFALISGNYSELLGENFSMDDLVTKVLNDIELVWCNCIKFNVIGSAVSRMAFVLRRRVLMIRRRSVDHKLSDKVLRDVNDNSQQFENAWNGQMGETLPEEFCSIPVGSKRWKENAIRRKMPKSKITLKASGHGKPIAILDTVSGRVVKTYSTAKSASEAAQILLNNGNRCELKGCVSSLNLKLIAQKSASDPLLLLFGYRWVFLEELNEGRVVFPEPIFDVIQMQIDRCTFVFRSIEEALSSSELSKTIDINGLRKKLINLPQDDDWAGIDGIKWRRPFLPEVVLDEEIPSTKDSTISIESQLAFSTESLTCSGISTTWKNCTILKKDIVLDNDLIGFEHITFAHQDWVKTTVSSPTFPEAEARSLENFKTYYLDGDRNVDGVIWITIDGRKINEEKEGKKSVTIDNHTKSIKSESRRQNFSRNAGRSVSVGKEESISMFGNESPKMNTLQVTSKPLNDLATDESLSRKRKMPLDNKELVELQTSKEARFSTVTV